MSREVALIPEHTPLSDAWKHMAEAKANTLFIGHSDHLAGIVGRKDLERAMESGLGSQSIGSIAAAQFDYLHPDQPLELALERFGTTSDILPVVSRLGRKLEGIITLDTILQFIQKKPA